MTEVLLVILAFAALLVAWLYKIQRDEARDQVNAFTKLSSQQKHEFEIVRALYDQTDKQLIQALSDVRALKHRYESKHS